MPKRIKRVQGRTTTDKDVRSAFGLCKALIDEYDNFEKKKKAILYAVTFLELSRPACKGTGASYQGIAENIAN
jgi:hypothetical protein